MLQLPALILLVLHQFGLNPEAGSLVSVQSCAGSLCLAQLQPS